MKIYGSPFNDDNLKVFQIFKICLPGRPPGSRNWKKFENLLWYSPWMSHPTKSSHIHCFSQFHEASKYFWFFKRPYQIISCNKQLKKRWCHSVCLSVYHLNSYLSTLRLCSFLPLQLCPLHLCTFAPLHLCTFFHRFHLFTPLHFSTFASLHLCNFALCTFATFWTFLHLFTPLHLCTLASCHRGTVVVVGGGWWWLVAGRGGWWLVVGGGGGGRWWW